MQLAHSARGIALLLAVLVGACGDSTPSAPVPVQAPAASGDVLVGKWQADFEASWARSRDEMHWTIQGKVAPTMVFRRA